MALESGKVATGDTIQATDYNKLRNDLLTNHTHGSGEGGTIDHKDLGETGDMSGMGHRHEDIDVHLNGSGPGPNSIDNPGGTQGVHGLASTAYVAGSLDSQLVIQADTDTGGTSGSVSFPVSFDAAPVVATGLQTSSSTYSEWDVRIYNVTASGFSWRASNSIDAIHWIAIGTKT